jgi:hypothetical protein
MGTLRGGVFNMVVE